MIVNALRFIGSILYGLIMYYLMWLFFDWIIPFIMLHTTWALFIVYLLFAGGFVSIFMATISSYVIIPLSILSSKCKYAKYAPIPLGLIWCYFSVKIPWCINMDYGVLQWILAISLTIIVLITFISLMYTPLVSSEE